jgi:iron complex outermembrane recepter protein
MRLIKTVILIFLTSQFTSLFAQNSLSGKISGIKDNVALKLVSVYIPELKKGTQSDESGKYFFDDLPKTTFNVQFSMLGFKTLVKTINLNTNSSLDVQLETSVTELEEVLVTSSNTKLPDNIPFSANSISQNEIRKFGATSVIGNLSYQSGIDKISIGNGIAKPVIRGLSFNQIMLYGQGTRIENQQWDDHHDLGLSDVGVENVEIVRGPAALIYGADALGGALIFNDEKPAPSGTTVGDVNLGFASNTLGFNGDAGIKGTSRNGFFYGIRLGGTSQTSYLQGKGDEENNSGEEEEFAPNSKFMNTVGKVNAGISKKWGVSKLSYSYLNQKIGIIEDESKSVNAGEDDAEQRDREMEAPYQDVTSHIVSLENTVFTGKSKLNLNVAYQLNDRKEYEPLADKQKELAIGLKLNTTTYDLKWTSNAEKEYGISIGSQGTFLNNENNGKEALVPNAKVSDIAGYGVFRYDHSKLNLLGGIRFDMRHIEAESYEENPGLEEDTLIMLSSNTIINKPETDFEKDYTPLSFSLGAAYHLNNELTIKLNAATGFSAPNYAQLGTYGKHEGTFRFERGDAALKVEQNTEGDLGLIWENEFISFNLGGYINKVKDYIYITNTGDSIVRITPDGRDTLPVYDYRQGNATLAGGEFGFDIHPENAKWLDFKTTYAVTNGKLDAGGNLPYIPSNKLVSEIKLSMDKVWKFNDTYFSLVLSNYSKQKNVAEYELSTDGYTLLDAYIGASFSLWKQKPTFNLFCTNLLNTGYYNQLSLVKYIGVREMGRNIGFQLHIPFALNKK